MSFAILKDPAASVCGSTNTNGNHVTTQVPRAIAIARTRRPWGSAHSSGRKSNAHGFAAAATPIASRGAERAPPHERPHRERTRRECDRIVEVADARRDVVPHDGERESSREAELPDAFVLRSAPPRRCRVLQEEDYGKHAQGQHDLHEDECVPTARETEELGRDDRNRTELELRMRAIHMQSAGADESTGVAEQQSGGIVEVVPRGCVLERDAGAGDQHYPQREVHVPRVELAGTRAPTGERGCTGAIVTR